MQTFINPFPTARTKSGRKSVKLCVTTIRPTHDHARHRVRCRASASSSETGAVQDWMDAARDGDISRMTKMIRGGVIETALLQDSANGQTALHSAVVQADAMTVRALFELARGVGGARQDFRHRTDEAQLLMNMKDADGNTPLHIAAARKDDEAVAVVQSLLVLGASTDMRNNRGKSPVDVVNEEGRRDVIELLSRN